MLIEFIPSALLSLFCSFLGVYLMHLYESLAMSEKRGKMLRNLIANNYHVDILTCIDPYVIRMVCIAVAGKR